MMMELEEEGFLQQLSNKVLLTIVKCAYDAHDVVLADAENRSLPAATKPVALVEVMSVLGTHWKMYTEKEAGGVGKARL